MKKILLSIGLVAVLSVTILTGCGDNVTEVSADPAIEAVTETAEPVETSAPVV